MILKLSRCVIRILVDDPYESFWEPRMRSPAIHVSNDNDPEIQRDHFTSRRLANGNLYLKTIVR